MEVRFYGKRLASEFLEWLLLVCEGVPSSILVARSLTIASFLVQIGGAESDCEEGSKG